MLALGLVLNTVGIGLFCWLIFTLAVYALPFLVGLTAGMAAFHSGAGVIGGTAWARMTVFAEPLPLRSSGTSRNEPQPILTGAIHRG